MFFRVKVIECGKLKKNNNTKEAHPHDAEHLNRYIVMTIKQRCLDEKKI